MSCKAVLQGRVLLRARGGWLQSKRIPKDYDEATGRMGQLADRENMLGWDWAGEKFEGVLEICFMNIEHIVCSCHEPPMDGLCWPPPTGVALNTLMERRSRKT